MSKLTKDTTIGEILKNYSNAQDVLKGFGMHCFACPMSQMETIEQAGAVHGLDIDFTYHPSQFWATVEQRTRVASLQSSLPA